MRAKNILMSFYYLKQKPNVVDFVRTAKDCLGDGSSIFVDSGAFTFLSENNQRTLAEIEVYLTEYIAFLKAAKEYISVAVNLDIEDIAGIEQVNQWNKRFEELEREGLRICYVWHSIRKVKGFDDYAGKYRYIGIPGGDSGLVSANKMVYLGRKHKTVFHGFGLTKPSVLIRHPYYSADSSSWLAGEEYGVSYLWTGANFLTMDKENKHRRKRYKNKFIQAGIDFEKLLDDEPTEVNKMNILAWLEAEQWISRRNRTKEYWEVPNMPQEKTDKPIVLPIVESLPIIPKTALESKMHCANCYLGQNCTQFKQGQECLYDFSVQIESPKDMLDMAKKLIALQSERVVRAMHIEKADGGAVDKTISHEMKTLMNLISGFKELTDNRDSLEIKAKGQGILTKIFGSSAVNRRD